jgi:hypothetical protein
MDFLDLFKMERADIAAANAAAIVTRNPPGGKVKTALDGWQ